MKPKFSFDPWDGGKEEFWGLKITRKGCLLVSRGIAALCTVLQHDVQQCNVEREDMAQH